MLIKMIPLSILLAVGCSDGRKILKPGTHSNATGGPQTNLSKNSSADGDKSLIKEVGSENNSATNDPAGTQLQWAKTTYGDVAVTPTSTTVLEISSPIAVLQEAESSRNYHYAIRANEAFTGIVNISANLEGLVKIDPAKEISVQIAPEFLNLEGGKAQDFTLNVIFRSTTPDTTLVPGASAKFRLIAQVKNGPSAEISIGLTVADCAARSNGVGGGCSFQNKFPTGP